MDNFPHSMLLILVFSLLVTLLFGKIEFSALKPKVLIKKGAISQTPLLIGILIATYIFMSDGTYIIKNKLLLILGIILVFQQIVYRYSNEE